MPAFRVKAPTTSLGLGFEPEAPSPFKVFRVVGVFGFRGCRDVGVKGVGLGFRAWKIKLNMKWKLG